MPELPEVEVTRRSMTALLEGRKVQALRVYQPRLRWPVPRALGATLAGRRLRRIDRRGKYLLWRFEHGVLISHLGMTGSWRVYPTGPV
jgi:formamidopyrimidine-DNA glycosylase